MVTIKAANLLHGEGKVMAMRADEPGDAMFNQLSIHVYCNGDDRRPANQRLNGCQARGSSDSLRQDHGQGGSKERLLIGLANSPSIQYCGTSFAA